MRKRLLLALGAAVAAAVAVRRSVAAQEAERDLWAEATDDVAAGPGEAPAAAAN